MEGLDLLKLSFSSYPFLPPRLLPPRILAPELGPRVQEGCQQSEDVRSELDQAFEASWEPWVVAS